MICQASSNALAPTPVFAGVTASYTSNAFEYPSAEADEPFVLKVVVGTLAGTTPSCKVTIQTQQIGQSTATGKWATAFVSAPIASAGGIYIPITIPLGGKVRYLMSTANADNTGTPNVELYSRTKPVADTTA